jgi:hypothetical protein
LGENWRKDLQEGKFQQRDQTLLGGEPRVIKNPGILLDHGQKVFFIFSGEVFSGEEIDVFVVAVVEIRYIQGNEEGDE